MLPFCLFEQQGIPGDVSYEKREFLRFSAKADMPGRTGGAGDAECGRVLFCEICVYRVCNHRRELCLPLVVGNSSSIFFIGDETGFD